MRDKLLKIVEGLSDEHIIGMLHHSGIDVEHALEALQDNVQKDKSDWEKIKNQPRKYSDIAKNKPKGVPKVDTFNVRSKLPEYLEEQSDGQGIGEY